MHDRLIELHQQRGRLLERIGTQRAALARQIAPLQHTFNLPDRIAATARRARDTVRAHPLVMTTAIVALVVLRPMQLLRWTQRGLLAWKTWRTMRRVVPGFVWDQFRPRA